MWTIVILYHKTTQGNDISKLQFVQNRLGSIGTKAPRPWSFHPYFEVTALAFCYIFNQPEYLVNILEPHDHASTTIQVF